MHENSPAHATNSPFPTPPSHSTSPNSSYPNPTKPSDIKSGTSPKVSSSLEVNGSIDIECETQLAAIIEEDMLTFVASNEVKMMSPCF